MTATQGRFVVVLAVYLAWLSYLSWQVWKRPVTDTGLPLVVSRPQILTSQIDIIARIEDPEQPVTVEEVLYPAETSLQPGERISVAFLSECRPILPRVDMVAPADYSGPGRYLLPLRQAAPGKYEVAVIPFSPGFRTALVSKSVAPGTAVMTATGTTGRILPSTDGKPAPMDGVRVQLISGSEKEFYLGELHHLAARIYPATREVLAQYHQIGKED